MQRILIALITVIIFNLSLNSQIFAYDNFPETGSPSIILIDSKTGQILYEKNSHQKLYPASITKVMTALLALENCKLDEKTIASEKAIFNIEPGSSNASFQPGEELTVEQLLYALLLNSANEAANILAEHIAGSIENFVDMMNKRAKELGALDTHFVNPNGLHDDNHYTTAYDMALIARHAMTIPKFREIVSTVVYKMPNTNKYSKGDKYFLNGNKLIRKNHSSDAKNYYYPYAIGIKTGYTTKAGHSLIAAASKDGIELIAVIMNSSIKDGILQTYSDSKKLFDYVFNNYKIETPIKANSVVKEISISNAKGKTPLKIIAENEVQFLVPINQFHKYTTNMVIHPNLKAPISNNTSVGYLEFLLNGSVIGKTKLLAGNDVPAASWIELNFKSILISFLVILRNIAVVILGLFLILVIYVNIKRRFKRGAKKQKPYSMKIEKILND